MPLEDIHTPYLLIIYAE